MATISATLFHFTSEYKEPEVTDIGAKARKIMETHEWEQPAVEEIVAVPGRIFRKIMKEAGLKGLHEIESGIPMLGEVNDFSFMTEEQHAQDLFEDLTYNIENKVCAAAMQDYGTRIIRVMEGRSMYCKSKGRTDYDVYDRIYDRLKTFFEARGLEFSSKCSSMQGGNPRVLIGVRWSNNPNQAKAYMTDYLFN